MSNRISQMDRRLSYKNASDIVVAAGVSLKVAKLTQSTLRLEQQVLAGKNSYTFGVLVNELGPSNSLFNTEVRLRQQDSYFVNEIVFKIFEPTSATDTNYVEYTYPNPNVFVAAGPPTEAAALESLYKGVLRMTINNDVVMPSLHMGRFRQVPISQKVTAAANQNGIADDSMDGSTDGLNINEPFIILIGSKANEIQINMPAPVATVGGFTRMVLELRGLLAQNSTIIT